MRSRSIGLYAAARRCLRGVLFAFLRRIAATEDARRLAADMLAGMLCPAPPGMAPLRDSVPRDRYPELAAPAGADDAHAPPPIFITGRFRSGSTLLWNIFRQLRDCTAYYEPFNERRWFDGAARGGGVDPSHRGVQDYWREYEGLAELALHYDAAWTRRRLLMGPDAWDPGMKRFLDILLERARGRAVLQFNRIDFRLPWVRRHFARARILHVYRHPRDQWCSALHGAGAFPRDATMADFLPWDGFYLSAWAQDLAYHFPFLDPRGNGHPYRYFYYLWRLSYLFGAHYADASVAFEDLVRHPESTLQATFQALDMEVPHVAALAALVQAPALGRWRAYADDAWFKGHEAACESVLAGFVAWAPPADP